MLTQFVATQTDVKCKTYMDRFVDEVATTC